MKRRDNNRQLRPDELDALEDETEEPGVFERASADVIAARRIIKPKRLSLESSDTPVKNPFNSFGSMSGSSNSSNPFSGFSGLTKQPAPIPKAEPIIKQTPATFGLGSISKQPLAYGSLSSTPSQPSIPSTAQDRQREDGSNGTTLSKTVSSSNSTKSKIERLNESFVSWLEKQSLEHPISVWSGGLQDYIKYATKISEESQNTNPEPSLNQTISNSTAPAPAPAANALTTPSFGLKKLEPPTSSQAEAPPKAFTGFSFPSNSSTPSLPTVSPAPFSFGAKPAAPAGSNGGPSTNLGGFLGAGFGGSKIATNAAPQFGLGFSKPKAEEEGADEGEGEGEEVQQLEPIEILKNENDTDQILLEVSTKLFRFDKSSNEWKDIGKGTLRVTCDPSQPSSKKRILIRNNLGKISLNTNIWKGMSIKQSGKNGIQFYVPDESKTIQLFLIKVKPEELQKTFNFISQIEKSL